MMRLDKYVSTYHFCSRQDAKNIIKKGRVQINHNIIKDSQFKLNETEDLVTIDGETVAFVKNYYIMLHKPAGVVCSARERGQQSILELIHEPYAGQLFAVGRLDKDTEGLVLLTNDGNLAHDLLSPARHVMKTYYAELQKKASDSDIEAFKNGIDIGDDKPTLPAILEITDNPQHVYVKIREGRFHQIKRMFEKCDNKVIYLKRLRMKDLELDPVLKPGEYRPLSQKEIDELMR